ncbi:MAG: hypothetical protein JSS53_06095, partial [Proteobacteria bacterium]|nr:hypothetical protein [Pseudomonadota bacterium]
VSERETFKIALFSWYQANMVDGLTEQDDGFVFEKINPHWQRVYNRYSHMTVRDLNKQLFGDRKVLAIRLDASDFVELSIDFSDGTEKFWDQLLTNLQSQGLISNYHTENSNFYFSIAALDNFSFEFTTQYGVLCQTLINQIFEYSVVETERCQDKVSGLFTNELLWPTGDTVNAHFTVLEEKGFISSYVEEGTKFFVVKDPQGMFFCLADRLGIDCSSDDASIIDELQPSSPISCAC